MTDPDLRYDREVGHDRETDSRVSAWLTGTDLSPDEADAGLDRVLREFPVTPQVKRRFLGRWFDRQEGTGLAVSQRDPPSGAGGRSTLLLSATGVTAAIVLLALTISVADIDQPLPDVRVPDLVVAADGTGDFRTIAAAVAAADAGDLINVEPGTYTEAVVIDKDITLAGTGPREQVIITAPDEGPVHRFEGGPTEPYAIALMGSDAEVSGLTLTGERSSLLVDGGAPTLHDLYFLDVTAPFAGAANTDLNALVIAGGSRATLTDSFFERSGPLGVYWSDPSVVGNTFLGGSHIWGRFGDEAVIADNRIDGALNMAVWVLESGPMLVESNVITGGHATGIDVGSKGDSAARIRDNRIADTDVGITVRVGDGAEISGNELTHNGIGVRVSRFEGRIVENEISGGSAGIVVVSGGTPEVAGNTIDVVGRGIVAGAGTSPLIGGNDVCGDEVSIRVSDGATPQITENQVCAGDVLPR